MVVALPGKALVRPLLGDVLGAVADFFLLGATPTGARGRRRDYHLGKPVFIRVAVWGSFPNADHLRLEGARIWVVSNKGFDAERRTELAPSGDVEVVRKGRFGLPHVIIQIDGAPVRIRSLDDSQLLVEAIDRWRSPSA